jgi:hypothetical protein
MKWSIAADDIIIYAESPKKSTKTHYYSWWIQQDYKIHDKHTKLNCISIHYYKHLDTKIKYSTLHGHSKWNI